MLDITCYLWYNISTVKYSKGQEEIIMRYNMKYFIENAKRIDGLYSDIYVLDGHRIVISECGRCSRRQYFNVSVDGITVATRAILSNTIRIALNYLNAM